jgi:transcriptional regulator with XRE-family HTH domain
MRRARDEFGIIRVVAQNVRSARIALGLSQEELAHEAEVDRTYVSQVERRKRNITIVVLSLAKALRTTPDQLLVAAQEALPRRRR